MVLNFDSDKPWETVIAIPDAVGAFAKSDVDTKAKDAQKKKDEEKPEEKTDSVPQKDYTGHQQVPQPGDGGAQEAEGPLCRG